LKIAGIARHRASQGAIWQLRILIPKEEIVQMRCGWLLLWISTFLAQSNPGALRADMMQMTRKQFEKDRAEYLALLQKELRSCSGGAYQVWIETPGFRHNSFGDLNLVRAAGNSEDKKRALKSLRVVETYTHAFFEKYLNGAHDTLLDHGPAKRNDVKIEGYEHQWN
jgi:hypothetical protein